MDFKGQHILSVSQFDRAGVERVFAVADRMRPYALRRRVTRVLEGAILGNMFLEPSTRTRVSFGSAFNLLGGEVRDTTEVRASSLVKGESLYDTARVLSGYSDVIVLRHWQEYSVHEFAEASRVPVINGGDGANEHPSQALLDLYTIRNEMAARGAGVDELRIALVGDLKFGRAVHSLSRLLGLYKRVQFKLISPPELQLPEHHRRELLDAGHEIVVSDRLESGIQDTSIVYVTRVQEERFPDPAEAERYRGLFRLNQAIYTEHCEPNTVIMHPLPRNEQAGEVSTDLNDNPNLAIFRQTDNGILVRMALFALLLDVAEQVDEAAREVNWYSGRRG